MCTYRKKLSVCFYALCISLALLACSSGENNADDMGEGGTGGSGGVEDIGEGGTGGAEVPEPPPTVADDFNEQFKSGESILAGVCGTRENCESIEPIAACAASPIPCIGFTGNHTCAESQTCVFVNQGGGIDEQTCASGATCFFLNSTGIDEQVCESGSECYMDIDGTGIQDQICKEDAVCLLRILETAGGTIIEQTCEEGSFCSMEQLGGGIVNQECAASAECVMVGQNGADQNCAAGAFCASICRPGETCSGDQECAAGAECTVVCLPGADCTNLRQDCEPEATCEVTTELPESF